MASLRRLINKIFSKSLYSSSDKMGQHKIEHERQIYITLDHLAEDVLDRFERGLIEINNLNSKNVFRDVVRYINRTTRHTIEFSVCNNIFRVSKDIRVASQQLLLRTYYLSPDTTISPMLIPLLDIGMDITTDNSIILRVYLNRIWEYCHSSDFHP
jgi:hypothetical protein